MNELSDLEPMAVSNQPFSVEDFIEEREFQTTQGIETYRVLVVDSHEKWQPAKAFSTKLALPVIGTDRQIEFTLRPLSLREWEEVESKYVVPELLEGQEKPKDHDIRLRETVDKRRVSLFEVSTGNQIPGATMDEKVQWLRKRNPGEIDSLFLDLRQRVCNLTRGSADDLALRYSIASKESRKPETVSVNSFSDWESASAGYTFRMHRPFQDYILEFPIKGLSQEQKEKIDEETQLPPAPKILARGKDGRFDPTKSIPNTNDISWLSKTRSIAQKRAALFLIQCLAFEIPGMDVQEKYNWIADRVVGDVIKVREFIEDELLSYRGQLDFFIN